MLQFLLLICQKKIISLGLQKITQMAKYWQSGHTEWGSVTQKMVVPKVLKEARFIQANLRNDMHAVMSLVIFI